MIHPNLGCMLWGLFEVLFLFLIEYVLIIVSCFCDDSLRLLCMFLLRRGFHLNSRYNIRWPQKKTWIIFNLYIGQSIAQLRSINTGWCKESSPFLSDMAIILADQHLRGTSLVSLAWTRTRTTEREIRHNNISYNQTHREWPISCWAQHYRKSDIRIISISATFSGRCGLSHISSESKVWYSGCHMLSPQNFWWIGSFHHPK